MPNPSTKRLRVNTRVKSRMRDSGVFAAGDAPGEGIQVEVVRIRHCQHPAEHDRRHPAAGQAMALDRGQHRFRVELAVHAQRPAHPQHRDARQVERADVIQRPHHQQPSLAVSPSAITWSMDFQWRLPYECITPLGRDVVPDVYIRRTRSVSATATCGGISRPG